MVYGILKWRILEIIGRERRGATAAEIQYSLDSFEDNTAAEETIRVTISQLIRRDGFLYTVDKERCDHCATLRKRYYLTEQGRIKLDYYRAGRA